MASCGVDEACVGLSQLLQSQNESSSGGGGGDVEEGGLFGTETQQQQQYSSTAAAAAENSAVAAADRAGNSHNNNNNNKEDTTDVDPESDTDEIKATVFMISGCQDKQTSADVSNVSNFRLPDPNGKAGGACTSSLLQILYQDHRAVTDLTFAQVMNKMRTQLYRQRFSQVPQLSSSQALDLHQDFYLVPPDHSNGTKRAVLIGINYYGQAGELSGCVNDCLNMKDYIMDVWGFKEENILVLTDDGSANAEPTRANILSAYKHVASQSKSGDAVFCHYSGHGGRIRDDDWGEEVDGYDETLIPVDFNSAGQIRDDDLYTTLVCAMPEGVHLVALMDCCHSGSVLDLPYKFKGGNGQMTLGNPGSPSGSSSPLMMCLCCCLILIALAITLPLTLT